MLDQFDALLNLLIPSFEQVVMLNECPSTISTFLDILVFVLEAMLRVCRDESPHLMPKEHLHSNALLRLTRLSFAILHPGEVRIGSLRIVTARFRMLLCLLLAQNGTHILDMLENLSRQEDVPLDGVLQVVKDSIPWVTARSFEFLKGYILWTDGLSDATTKAMAVETLLALMVTHGPNIVSGLRDLLLEHKYLRILLCSIVEWHGNMILASPKEADLNLRLHALVLAVTHQRHVFEEIVTCTEMRTWTRFMRCALEERAVRLKHLPF